MLNSLDVEHDVAAVLQVHGPGNSPSVMGLKEGQELVVGSESTADIRLPGPDIAAMHCLIGVHRHHVVLRDCYSKAGTFVQDQRISEITISRTSEIRVGDYILQLTISRPVPQTNENETDSEHANAVETAQLSEEPADTCAPTSEPLAEARENQATSVARNTIRDLQQQLEQSHALNDLLRDQLDVAQTQLESTGRDVETEEMLDLLRQEVLDLQSALEERDQTPKGAEGSPEPDALIDCLPREDAERLVDRLEQLLQELQERDEHVGLLTDLLEAAEEANRAEQEERRQLKSWVADIEHRIAAREEEWDAERTQLLQQRDSLASDRDRVNATVNAATSNAKFEALQRVLEGVREEQADLQKELDQSVAECHRLRREVEETKSHDFREDEIRISQERAELARLRHELEKVKHAPVVDDDASDANIRMRALRQHLTEIHEQERQHRQEQSLAGRLARLWSRL